MPQAILHPLQQHVSVTMQVNGQTITRTVEARMHLADFLRDVLGLTGSHVGCEHGVCGACTLRIDGAIMRGCLVLAAQLDGASVETIEGLTTGGEFADLQEAFVARNALQCGFCTPGMVMCASELLTRQPNAGREQIREFISGNYCRCTGYEAIVDAIETTAAARSRDGAPRKSA